MRVLHYIPSIDRSSGGVGIYMQQLARELGKLVELHIVTHRSANELKIDYCTIHYIGNRWFLPYKERQQFNSLMQEVTPDVLHINTCWQPMASFIVFWNKQKWHCPVVYTPHGMLEPWIMHRHHLTRKWPALLLYQRKALRMADLIHATAESERRNILALGYNSHVTIVPNGIDLEPAQMKQSWERTYKILFLSRVHIKKGVNFLIEAAAQMKEQLQNYTFIIAGDGDETYIRKLKELAVARGTAQNFVFTGGIYGDWKWQLYREADLFVLPTHSENFGIVVAEALACGTPVLTTTGTPWEELETHHCGWLTDVGTMATATALADFLRKTPTELEAMGRNGRKLVEEKYSNKTIATQMAKLYDHVRVQ